MDTDETVTYYVLKNLENKLFSSKQVILPRAPLSHHLLPAPLDNMDLPRLLKNINNYYKN